MKKLTLIVLSILIFSFVTLPIISVGAADDDAYIQKTEKFIADNIRKVEITKSLNYVQKSISKLSATENSYIQQYKLNPDLYILSSQIIVQQQVFNFDPTHPVLIGGDGDVSGWGKWDDADGYMSIYTVAYRSGSDSAGDANYLIESTIIFHNVFAFRNQDEMTIQHSADALYLPSVQILLYK